MKRKKIQWLVSHLPLLIKLRVVILYAAISSKFR